MRLNKTLSIGGIKRNLVDEHIALDLYAPGRAEFTIVNDEEVVSKNQLVTFDFGYSTQATMQRWFIGVTDQVVTTGDKRVKIFCRELSSVLIHTLPLNLRHVSMREVLKVIHDITGLDFSTPDKDYATRKVANFYNLGNGYQAMAALENVFNIPDFIWQQQSGVIYAGSWADSRWASVKNMLLPENLFIEHSAQNSAKVVAFPTLRPGIRISGKRINIIEFSGNHMVLKWT
jgi:hypothetical protein